MSIYNGVIVQDPLEVIVYNGTTAKFFGCTQEGNVSQTIDQTELICGIGSKVKAILNKQKTITFNVQTGLHNSDFIAYNSGTSFTSASFDIYKNEQVVATGTGTITATITGTPKSDTVYVTDIYGKTYVATHSTGTVTITSGVAGETYNVAYLETTANVDQLDLDVDSFPSDLHVVLHTIAYDENADEIVADIYWDFPKAVPDGSIDESYSGDAKVSTIGFKVIDDGTGSYGTYMIVERS